MREYAIDGLWESAAELKATYNPSLADAYAVAAAEDLGDARNVTLLVGADYDTFEGEARFEGVIERFRDGHS